MAFSLDNDNCLIVAEVAQAHDGSLGMAHSYIDLASENGADAIKFQAHIARFESTRREEWRVKFSKQDSSRYDYWERMEFTKNEWEGLVRHAKDKKLKFIVSPFSVESVKMLEDFDIDAWKIASGEIRNKPLIDYLLEKKEPLIFSTGMSDYPEIDRIVKKLKSNNNEFSLLQCTSSYPCQAEELGLNVIDEFKRKYQCNVGLSDHSGTIYPSLAAAYMGVSLIELHVTLSKEMFGPDVSSSLTFDELRIVCDGAKYMDIIRNNPVDKSSISSSLSEMKRLFGKSIVAKTDLKSGHLIDISDLAFKKPGEGISPDKYELLLGKKLKRDLDCDDVILLEDIDK